MSTNSPKNIYWQTRLDLQKSRAEACFELGLPMSETRLEKIETGKISMTPNDVIMMSEAYKCPELCNYYCTHDCDIGKQNAREVKEKDLYRIVVETLANLQALNSERENFIEITADGIIDESELETFAVIYKKLQQISDTAESLQLWLKKMQYDKSIDADRLAQIFDELK